MEVDYLIVGQGLAGSLLGWLLLNEKCRILIVDTGRSNASRVAAGLINPVTGMRLIKTDRVETLLPDAIDLYQRLEGIFRQPFYRQLPMLRLLHSSDESQQVQRRCRDSAYSAYLGPIIPREQIDSRLTAPFGAVLQKQTGYLSTVPLLDCLKKYFIADGSYLQCRFDYQQLHIDNQLIRWRQYRAKNIVFCEGYRCRDNPWFSWLPMQPVKGEILTLETEETLPETMINSGNWLIPLDAHQFRTGATFDRTRLDELPTGAGRQQLLEALAAFCPFVQKPRIIAQQAGVRPCTRDKKPFLGSHPQYPHLYIFNGFGAKGSLQIPYYARRFRDFLLSARPLPASASIQRCHAAHFPG